MIPQESLHSVAVIGNGVIGLTSALRLAQAECSVCVIAPGPVEATTSARAGAVFSPFGARLLDPVIVDSFRCFTELTGRPGTGVRMARAVEHFAVPLSQAPAWAALVGKPRALPPAGPFSSGFEMIVPHIDMPVYLPALQRRAAETGVRFVQARVATFDELFAQGFGTVVNCTGLGARELANDPSVRGVRGQVLHVPNLTGLDASFAALEADGSMTYIYPFPDRMVLGGTFEVDAPDDATNEASLADITARCRRLLELHDPHAAERLGRHRLRDLAGLRPCRFSGANAEAVRLEAEQVPGGLLIHNYGHGRAGVTLSWGCAAEVVRLVRSHHGERSRRAERAQLPG